MFVELLVLMARRTFAGNRINKPFLLVLFGVFIGYVISCYIGLPTLQHEFGSLAIWLVLCVCLSLVTNLLIYRGLKGYIGYNKK